MRVLDLFSGLGGFSQAFLDRGHEVIRYDNSPRFEDVPNTIIRDVLTLTREDLLKQDVILAGPPCTCFSVASQARYWRGNEPREEKREEVLKAVGLALHAYRIMKDADPTYYILENPRGRLRNFLGKPDFVTSWAAWGTRYLKPTHLWGRLPPMEWPIARKWEPNSSGGAGNRHKNDPYPRDPAKRSLVPYQFSLALCRASEGLTNQTTLDPILSKTSLERGNSNASEEVA